jgi:hypothetical protein
VFILNYEAKLTERRANEEVVRDVVVRDLRLLLAMVPTATKRCDVRYARKTGPSNP